MCYTSRNPSMPIRIITGSSMYKRTPLLRLLSRAIRPWPNSAIRILIRAKRSSLKKSMRPIRYCRMRLPKESMIRSEAMQIDTLAKIIGSNIGQQPITLKTPDIPQKVSGKVTRNTITRGIKHTNKPIHTPITTKTGTLETNTCMNFTASNSQTSSIGSTSPKSKNLAKVDTARPSKRNTCEDSWRNWPSESKYAG